MTRRLAEDMKYCSKLDAIKWNSLRLRTNKDQLPKRTWRHASLVDWTVANQLAGYMHMISKIHETMSCIPNSIVNMVLCFWEKSTIKGGYFFYMCLAKCTIGHKYWGIISTEWTTVINWVQVQHFRSTLHYKQ